MLYEVITQPDRGRSGDSGAGARGGRRTSGWRHVPGHGRGHGGGGVREPAEIGSREAAQDRNNFV